MPADLVDLHVELESGGLVKYRRADRPALIVDTGIRIGRSRLRRQPVGHEARRYSLLREGRMRTQGMEGHRRTFYRLACFRYCASVGRDHHLAEVEPRLGRVRH